MHRINRTQRVRNALGGLALVWGCLSAWVSAWAQAPAAPLPVPGVSAPASAAPAAAGPAIGEVTFSRGVGFAQQPGLPPRTLGVGLPLVQGDRLTTGSASSAIVRLNDGTRLTLRPDSELVLEQYRYREAAADNNMVLQLLRGGLRALTGLVSKNNSRAAAVRTPTATIGIRGTDFDARICSTDCAARSATVAGQSRPANLKASAKAVAVQGDISVLDAQGVRRPVVHGSSVYPGDVVETGAQGQAVLAFRDESKVAIGAGTRFRVDDFVFDRANPSDGRFLVSLLKGTVRALTGLIGKSQARNVSFRTPTATIGIRGTGLDLSCDDAGCRFFNWLGSIEVTPQGHSALQVLQAGQGLLVTPSGIRPLTELPLPGLPRPDEVPVDLGPLFLTQDVDETEEGVYVWVRDGHVELFAPQGVVHLGRGEVGLARPDSSVLRPVRMPLFLELDPTPLPNHPNPLLASVLGEAGVQPLNQCR